MKKGEECLVLSLDYDDDSDICPKCGTRSSTMFSYVDEETFSEMEEDYYECRNCGYIWEDK